MAQTPALILPAGGEYTWPFRVRHYELDRAGRVRPEVYLNWLQELGIQASAASGYPLARYEALGAFWWVRRFWIEWLEFAGYGDELEATTWISEFRRLRCRRQYLIRRKDNGRVAFRAQAEWAFVDVAAGQPMRIPAEMLAAFPALPLTALEATDDFAGAPKTACAEAHLSAHTVARHELDTMGHVNNAQYLVWLFENLAEATGASPAAERLDIEYQRPARLGDRLEVLCWARGPVGQSRVWEHEVRAQDGTVLIRARSRCRAG